MSRYLPIGSFEPGQYLDGQKIVKWHVTNTSPTLTYRPVCVELEDGSKIFAYEVRK